MGGTGMYKIQKEESFGQFLWNSEKKQFLGRTGTSWCKIGVFYMIFYSCLAGFMAAMLAVFYQTLDTKYMPKYTPGDQSSILRNPAMGYRPSPKSDNIESTLIWYRNADELSIEHWVENLNNFILPYGEDVETKTFEGEEKPTTFIECNAEKTADPEKNEVCKFNDKWLEGNCTKTNGWGYSSESPCIILKLNKMIGWIPDVYQTLDDLPKDMPKSLRDHIQEQVDADKDKVMPKRVWVSCVGENPSDEEYIGDLKYSPWQGFPSYYFPFSNTAGYLSPIVAVEFMTAKPNVLINVECRAWAKNIKYDRGNRFGLVSFQILRD